MGNLALPAPQGRDRRRVAKEVVSDPLRRSGARSRSSTATSFSKLVAVLLSVSSMTSRSGGTSSSPIGSRA